VDFVEGQKAVTITAVLNEGRLQAGFDSGYLGEIDVSRSCLRDWLSKSKSSTREPSTTTTRVSSAWAASINILFVI